MKREAMKTNQTNNKENTAAREQLKNQGCREGYTNSVTVKGELMVAVLVSGTTTLRMSNALVWRAHNRLASVAW